MNFGPCTYSRYEDDSIVADTSIPKAMPEFQRNRFDTVRLQLFIWARRCPMSSYRRVRHYAPLPPPRKMTFVSQVSIVLPALAKVPTRHQYVYTSHSGLTMWSLFPPLVLAYHPRPIDRVEHDLEVTRTTAGCGSRPAKTHSWYKVFSTLIREILGFGSRFLRIIQGRFQLTDSLHRAEFCFKTAYVGPAFWLLRLNDPRLIQLYSTMSVVGSIVSTSHLVPGQTIEPPFQVFVGVACSLLSFKGLNKLVSTDFLIYK